MAWISVDRTGVKWQQTTDPRVATKTATTTSVASSNVTPTGVTLTATVAPSAATGTVQFTQGGTAIGSPVTVSGGVATTTVSGLTASTAYTFGAQYAGDSTYAASTGSVSVTTAAVPVQDSSNSTVVCDGSDVDQPRAHRDQDDGEAAGDHAHRPRHAHGGPGLAATGSLGNVTVDDDRQSASTSWTLNGHISAFTNGSASIPASNVGWAPSLVSGAGTAGAAVTAGSNGGLTADQPLATGTGSSSAHVTTTIGATITSTPRGRRRGQLHGNAHADPHLSRSGRVVRRARDVRRTTPLMFPTIRHSRAGKATSIR